MDILKAQQNEYDEVQTNIRGIHLQMKNRDEEIRNLILELVSETGGGYVKDVTEKLQELLTKEQGVVSDNLQTSFESIEKSIDHYIMTLKEIDKVE